jgi:ABC-type antimicrobial peptide transport system permease subunit
VKLGRLARLVGQNVARGRGSFVLGAFGIAVGVAAFAFLLALAGGISRVLLGQVFPAERLEVVQRKTSFSALAFLGGPARLTDDVAARLRARPEVKAAYPRMKVAFPARIWGGARFFGQDLQTEFVGDGIDASLVGGVVAPPHHFQDLERPGSACTTDAECKSWEYCPADLQTCQQPVPFLLSRYLLEIYNGQIARSHGMPQVNDFLVNRLRGFTVNVELGRSMIRSAPRGRPVVRRMQFVGVSEQAIPIGITVPIEYVRRWNAAYAGDRDATDYTSIVVTVRQKRDLTPLAAFIKEMGFDQADRDAEQAGLAITIVTALFALLATVIISVAAINIAHTFFAQVLERRRELGLLRAVGATRADVALLVLGEAGAVGLAGAVAGLLLARLCAALADLAARRLLPPFPFKPDTFFAFGAPLVLSAVGFAVLFALVGALWPAVRAARLDPAASLSAP